MSERIFNPATDTPASTNVNDGDNSKTLGMVVSLTEDMYCNGGAWYVPDTVPEIVTGLLWEYTSDSTGILRASKSLTGISPGWTNWTFDTPYLMDHTKLWVISVYTRTNYVITGNKFTVGFSSASGRITAVADSVAHNGRFHDATGDVGPIYPEANFNKSWYGLDIFATQAVITLAVADASQAQSADAVTLTQTHNLAVADAAQAQTVDSVTLTQVHNLTVQDAQQAQTADTVALSQNHILVVQDATQAQRPDTVDFESTPTIRGNVHGNDTASTGSVVYVPVALSGKVQ